MEARRAIQVEFINSDISESDSESDSDSDSDDSSHSDIDNNVPSNYTDEYTAVSFSSECDKLLKEMAKSKSRGKTTIREVCRICLCSDRKLELIKPLNLATFQEILTREEEEYEGDPLPQVVCWECKARMNVYSAFKAKACRSNKILSTLTSPYADKYVDISCVDRTAHGFKSNLQNSAVRTNHTALHYIYRPHKNKHDIQQVNLDLRDTLKLDYTYSSDGNILKKKPKI